MRKIESGDMRTKVERFLTKLDWKISTGEIKDIAVFHIDIYKFVFTVPLAGETLDSFIIYIKTLDMGKLKSIMKIFVWLYQQNVCFRLEFGWNRTLPVWYNLKNLFMPMTVRHNLLSCGHDSLMTCPLENKKGE